MEHNAQQEVTPGIWRLPLSLKEHSVGHVNVYALLNQTGVVLIDTGWGTAASWAALDSSLNAIGASARDVIRVLLTHFHADHCGSAGDLQARWGARVGMHRDDSQHLAERYFQHASTYRNRTLKWSRETGAPLELALAAVALNRSSAARMRHLRPDDEIEDGGVTRHGSWRLTALHTPGHTPGHLCFYEETTRTLFSGDHILPYINTSPGVRPHSSAYPVADYLSSLDRLAELSVARVLPGHQDPFVHLVDRVASLRAHHQQRLALTEQLVSEGLDTVWKVTRAIPRSRQWNELSDQGKISALGETYAHLRHLTSGRALTVLPGPTPRWVAD